MASAALLLAALGAQAQTTTVVGENFEGATNSFTLVNGTQVNQWAVGTPGGNGPTTTGTNSAFVSNDAGVSYAYTLTSTSVSHMYRDMTLPAGQTAIMSFDWKSGGESTYDYLLVQVAPTTFTPVAGTIPATTSVTVLAQVNLQPAYGRMTMQLPASLAGTTQRLIFTWRNDASLGTQPPAAIDNILVTSQVPNPISGAYTINNALPTAGTNFNSFTDAASRLNADGISGPTTLTVSNGPYNEQFLLNELPGSSATNTLTVNGGGRILRFAPSVSTQRAVVQLNGTDYTTINNLVIDATGGGTSGTYGYGVLLTNAADNDRITNSTIASDIASTSTNFTGIAVNGSLTSATTAGNSANNLTIENNDISGGYYAVTLYGNSATGGPLNGGNIIRNNQIHDFYLYGVYVGYQVGAQITGNDINRAGRANGTTFYGVYATGLSQGLAIEKNRIHDSFIGNPTSTSSSYGVYLTTSTGATATAPNDVVNNVIYSLSGNGSQYGIYNSSAAYIRIYNNTINADDQTSTATATYSTYGIYSSGTNSEVKNNVVVITRSGANVKYGLYYATNPPASNNNDIYVPSGNVGYYTTAYATLPSWQAANSAAFDQNSISVDPQFVVAGIGAGSLVPRNAQLNSTGAPLARVTDDITGATRGALPDMGAFEFTPVPVDLLPAALVGPVAGTSCFSPAEAVVVQIRNNGATTLNFATTAATVTVVVTPPSGTPQTFTTTVNTTTLASGAALSVTLPGTLNMTALGTYSFAITATVVGDGNTANDVLTPTPTYTVSAPVAGTLAASSNTLCVSGSTTLNLTGSANGSLQLQSGTSATGPFTDIAGAAATTYTTPVLTSTTYYRVRNTCNATTVYSNVLTVTVNNPLVATTNTPVTICSGTAATLTATASAGSSVRFFDAATGGTALATTAGSYTTAPLTASTTYYAEAFAGATENVGAPAFNSTGQTPQTGGALFFTATTATTINAVTVYLNAGQAAGTVTISLRTGSSSTGAIVNNQSTAFAVPAGPTTGVAPYVLPLNFSVPAAGQYTLYLGAASQTGLLRDALNGANSTFPYTSPSGVITITGTSVTGYYYYFYNWQIGSECVNATRTPVQVNVTPLPATPTLTAAAQPGGAILLTASTVAGATYQFYRGGVAVGTPSTSPTLLLQNGAPNGSYTVAIISGGCTSAQSTAVAVTVTGTRTTTLNGVSLLVYPNPTPDGLLTVELTGLQAKASALTVLNSLGQVVHARTIAPGTATLSLTNLAAGVYNLRVQTPDGVLTQRIVRE
ncbi:MAG: T9SS type A sorting domain-containing protein [Janthinobacterium lividum]